MPYWLWGPEQLKLAIKLLIKHFYFVQILCAIKPDAMGAKRRTVMLKLPATALCDLK